MSLLKRNQVDETITWNLKDLYESNDVFYTSLNKTKEDVLNFYTQYQGKINDAQTVVQALNQFATIEESWYQLSTYAELKVSEDQGDVEALELVGQFELEYNSVATKMNFLEQEIKQLDTKTLESAINLDQKLTKILNKYIKAKAYSLTPAVEDAITALNSTLESPYETYNMSKLVDMEFKSFEVDGKEIPLSFGYFEDMLEDHDDNNIRHAAYRNFYGTLAKYQNTFASAYKAQVLKEKAIGQLKGFDSTIDYLLFDQEVSREMYDKQLDTIMEHLAPPMRKYAKHLQEVHGLDTMTYDDLLLSVDPEYDPEITIEESKQYLFDALGILGDDYLAMIDKAFTDRWIDFPQNIGKSTGAFCASPYGAHPYVLISWTQKMREVFVLAHELGHAGHFYLAGQNQTLYNTEPSLYFIESPSTMNEMLMANHLIEKADNPRLKRWTLATLISRTYYHNFVTHFLEAVYQREVYRRIDQNKPINAHVLNKIYKDVLTQFWGDSIEITEGAELTWMRQPHYYMGLYSYTYSAGLTIATEVSQKIIHNELNIEDWKNVLKAGGSKSPLELAKMVNVDMSTEAPFINTINHIESIVDNIIELTNEINSTK